MGWQQLRDAFPCQSTPKFLIYDQDAKGSTGGDSIHDNWLRADFDPEPWQNGVASSPEIHPRGQ
jgi:hypothetical protein